VAAVSDLRESEIFDLLLNSFGEAASLCDKMAKSPLRGKHYRRLIEVTKLIEGTCRQAGHWRENHEWFLLGRDAHHLQIMYGNWIREQYRAAEAKVLFGKAADSMRRLKKLAEIKKNQKHGRLGMILPQAGEGPLRQRAVQVPRVTPGGIILPAGASLQ
jgi:hypothetical protein